jgi:hypothetical protein
MTRRHWNRRAFLRTGGVALALPLLESMRPRRSAVAATGDVPLRLLVIYTPNGMHMADWTPAAAGTDFALPPILTPLEPVRQDILVLSGIDNPPAETEGFGQHAPATASFLTCTNVAKSEDVANGISMDQVAANAIGDATRFASLQLGTDGGSNAGGCDGGYSCAYTRNISWANATTPMPKLIDPRAVFDLMFAGYDPEATAAELARRRVSQQSVIDAVLADTMSLQAKLGASDREKLDQYLTGVRELEMRLDSEGTEEVCPAIDVPPSDPNFPTKVRLMLDLMAIAVQCDLTRVVTFMMGNSISGQTFPFAGVDGAHHQISHHQGIQSNLAQLTKIDRWEVEQLVYLVEKLGQIDDGDGTSVLDNSIVYFSNEVSDGNTHTNRDLPILLAGRGGGCIAPGRHVRYDGESLSNLYIAMLQGLGVDIDQFGDDGTGPITGLT